MDKLTNFEQRWMDGISQSQNISKHKYFAYIFIIFGLSLLAVPYFFPREQMGYIYILPVTVLTIYIGVTRYAFYKLYRIIRHLSEKDK